MKDMIKLAKDVAKVSELKLKIVENKAHKEGLLMKLGENVYANYADIKLEEIDAIVSEIKNIDIEIEALETQIMVIKELKKCPVCGEVVDINQNYCGKCGALLPEAPKEEPAEVIEEADCCDEAECCEEASETEEVCETEEAPAEPEEAPVEEPVEEKPKRKRTRKTKEDNE